MIDNSNICFAFFPCNLHLEDIFQYIETVTKAFSGCHSYLSFIVNPGNQTATIPHFISDVASSRHKLNLAQRVFDALAPARTREVEHWFFNIAMSRYSAQEFINFAKISNNEYPTAHLVIGEPEKIEKEQIPEINDERAHIRKRLIIDLFINYVVSRAVHSPFANVNAGLFKLRFEVRDKNLYKTLTSVNKYHGSSLVCPQFYWNMRQSAFGSLFETKICPVKHIDLAKVIYEKTKSIREINYVYDMISRTSPNVTQDISDFFATKQKFNRWFRQSDEDWFWEEIVEGLRKLRKV